MQASLGFYSIMNSGVRSFEDVYRNDKDNSVYKTELYDIDYKNFTFSSGFHLKLGWNWIQKKRYSIRQTTSLAAEIYKEQVSFTLTNIGNGDSVSYGGYYGGSIVEVGYNESAVSTNLGLAATQELLFLRNKENYSWGGGISYNFRSRNDWQFNRNISGVYIPNSRALSWGRYFTHQLGLVFHIEKAFNRGMIYLNLNQQVLTLKKTKGAEYFTNGNQLNPVSHNMDFRFPLLIQFGGSLQFGKNKK
ncbi:MAG: hypothetical protein ACI857_002256 [Arenicella sp.]|jgi:hypothetical protein